jgi:hypothetical protein
MTPSLAECNCEKSIKFNTGIPNLEIEQYIKLVCGKITNGFYTASYVSEVSRMHYP